MYKYFTSVLILGACLSYSKSFSQSNTFPTTGNVGIGTASPLSGTNNIGMHIMKGDHSSIILGDPINGAHGGIVQTSDNKHRIFIGANLYDDRVNSWKNFVPNKGSAGISVVADNGGWGSSISFYVSEEDRNVGSKLIIRSNGFVGIGTESPLEKLSVKGNIRAHEIKVETANWPDYVFKSEYRLPSLSETEQFIKANGHLPDVPKAAEVETNGVSLGEMNKVLLKKVEELTLHLIEKDQEVKQQNQRIAEIETILNKYQLK
ncbi:hypothetical protein [Sphingobacterium anhuiense]|uniref:hypothetical protein n=1 Tax=Sphingobacterium anhuiense TaxID=493780 RepID=UPI003C2C0239